MKRYSRAIIVSIALIIVVVVGVATWTRNSPAASAASHGDKGDLYFLQKDYSRAAEEYKQSVQLRPNKDMKFTLGITLIRAGRRDEAAVVLRELAAENDRVGKAAQLVLDKNKLNSAQGQVGKSP